MRETVHPVWNVALAKGTHCMLCHGTPFTGSSWRLGSCILLLAQLAEGIVLDMPGYGYVVFHGVMACGV